MQNFRWKRQSDRRSVSVAIQFDLTEPNCHFRSVSAVFVKKYELAWQSQVIGVEFPLNPNYKNDDTYGKYGLRNSDAPEIVERLIGLSQKYSNFMFFDQHKMGEHDYLEGVSYDDDHLCRDGAKKMTLRLDSLLKTLD